LESEPYDEEDEEDCKGVLLGAGAGVLLGAGAGVLLAALAGTTGVLLAALADTTDALSSKSISTIGWKLAAMLGVGTV